MDQLREPPIDPMKPSYNHSISMIQSSGMAKSRISDAVAEIKFCFPFNIRERLSYSQFGNVPVVLGGLRISNFRYIAYPPADDCIRDFFSEPKVRHPNDDDMIQRKYMAFFVALFDCAAMELPLMLEQTSAAIGSIPKRWHDYLALGATEWRGGEMRRKFYENVIEVTRKVSILKCSIVARFLMCPSLARRTQLQEKFV
jgi:hypothetical protein